MPAAMRVFLFLLSLLILGLLAVLLAFFFFGGETPEMVLPDLAGKSFAEARAELERRGLLVTRTPVSGPDTAVNTVLRTSPAAGTHVKRGRQIFVYVVEGEPLVPVPDLVGTYFVDAENRLRRAGLDLNVAGLVRGKVIKIDLSDSPAGLILEQSPASPADSPAMVKPGSAVDLWIAFNSKAGDTMPDLVNRTWLEAKELMAALEYPLDWENNVVEYHAPPPAGVILNQTPAPGAKLSADVVIKLHVTVDPNADPGATSESAYPPPGEMSAPVAAGETPAAEPPPGNAYDN